METLCDIIIPVWNLPQKTSRCLQSILSRTLLSYRLILIDNASEKPTAEFLHEFQKTATCPVLLIRNEENLGNIRAVNQGIRLSRAPYVCILDNDTVVFHGWLEKMINAANSKKDIGIVNPASNSLGFIKPWYLSWDFFAKKIGEEKKGKVVEMATAVGFCMLIKREVIERIGGWCEDYGMGYYEDRDYSLRSAQAGFQCVVARDAFVYHEEHASFRRLRRKRKETAPASNRRLFESRFGISERIAFCLKKSKEDWIGLIKESALKLARNNHWIWIFHDKKSKLTDFPEHSNIKIVPLPDLGLHWNYIFHILKKKKRFQKIYSDDPKLIADLRRLSSIHKAEPQLLNRETSRLFLPN